MKRFLAFLLAIVMIVPLCTQFVVYAADDLQYTKSTQAYTVAGKSYYRATLTKDHNGVSSGAEFFVDASGNVVTDTELLKKLNAVNMIVLSDLVNQIRTNIPSGESGDYLINMCEACEVWINNGEIAGYLGSVVVDAIKTAFDLVSQDYASVLEDVIDFGSNAVETVEGAKIALLSSGVIDAVAYATKYYEHKKNIFEYPLDIYDYEQLEAFFNDYANFRASDILAQKICNVIIDDMLSDGTSIWAGAKATFKSFTPTLIASVFAAFDDEFLNLVGDLYSNLVDVYEEGQQKLFNNHSAIYKESYDSDMNAFFYAFCKASSEMIEIHSKLSSQQTTSSSYTTGTYTPSEYNGLNIRSGASTSDSIVGAIAYGTNFTVTNVSGIWGYTTCNGVSGWVCLDYVTKVTVSGNTNNYENTYNNTGNQRKDILGVAITQIGYTEESGGYNKYAQSTAEWCAYFVLWCAEQAGIPSSVIPRYAGCRQLYNGVISCGGTVVTEPIAGDLIFYRCTKCSVNGYSDAYSHVGIALESIYSIEGNRGGRVDVFKSAEYGGEPHYVSTGDVEIIYVRPNYKNTTSSSSKLPAPQITSSSTFTTAQNAVLTWKLDGADCYGVTVVNDQTNAVVFDGDISESSLNLGKLSAGKYRWQVRGYNDAGWGDLTSLAYFTVTSTSSSNGGLVTRDDGTWLFPVAKEYYQKFSDWCCCPGYDKCILCGTTHTSWGDSSHSGQKGHNGIDLATPSGTPVYAAASGKYYTGGSNSHDRGYYIVIEHDIGNGQAYYSAYQHLSSFNSSLSSGQYVNAGDVIGYTGGSGNGSGVHLHFGIVLGASGKGLGGLDTYELWSSTNPWATSPSHTQGRIVNNPADNFPTSTAGATLEAITAHKGSVHYTFDKTKVSIGSTQMPDQTQDVLVSAASKSTYTTDENIVINWNSYTGAAYYDITISKKTGDSWESRQIVYNKDGITETSIDLGKFDVGEYRFNMGAHSSDGTLLGQYSELSYFTVKSSASSDDFEWSDWSEWSAEKPTESDTVEVESKTQYGYYHYILEYSDGNCGAYPIDSATFNSMFPSYPTTQKDYHTKYFDTQLSKIASLTYDKAYDCYTNNCCPDAYDYDNGSNASYFYYLGTRTVYRSRTKISNTIPVTGIELNKSTLTLTAGKTDTLIAAIMPSDATNKNVTWVSSDPSVARVTNGMITAVSAGTAEITVTTENGNKTSKCTVTVIPVTSGVKAVMSSATSSHGDTVILTVTLEGAPQTDALAITLADLPEGITLIEDGTSWAIEGTISNFDINNGRGVWVCEEEIDPNGIVLKLAFKVEDAATLGENKISFEFYPDDSAKTPDAAIETEGIINVTEYTPGDVDGEEGITANDAIYVLYNVFFGDELYPVDQPCDFDGDSSVTANDAIYLLYYVFFGDEAYPLN